MEQVTAYADDIGVYIASLSPKLALEQTEQASQEIAQEIVINARSRDLSSRSPKPND